MEPEFMFPLKLSIISGKLLFVSSAMNNLSLDVWQNRIRIGRRKVYGANILSGAFKIASYSRPRLLIAFMKFLPGWVISIDGSTRKIPIPVKDNFFNT